MQSLPVKSLPTAHRGEVVVIDDTPANLRLLANLLSDAGYQVRPFPSGKLALAGLERCQPDLILLDVQMPQMNGYEVCQVLKSEATTQRIPIIFISALSEAIDKVTALTSGGVDYITKPFQAEEVLARVATHLELYRLQRQLQNQNNQQSEQLAQQNQQLQTINQTLQRQYDLLKQTQLQLVQTEKMATLGNLIAGVAHEVNNPISFISCNLQLAQEYIENLLDLVQMYEKITPSIPPEIHERIQEMDLDFIREDLPQIIGSMEKGVQMIQGISQSLRIFSRTEKTNEKTYFDLHTGLNSTLLILRYRLKANPRSPEIQVIKEYGEIPEIECYPGKLNQVFMNILANAIDAVEEDNTGRSYNEIEANPNQIHITTQCLDDRQIRIAIRDNGPGMTTEVQQQIFEQGFTTKTADKGTGLGLAISRQIIEVDHGGRLELTSALHEGTTFIITLPIRASSLSD